MSYVPGLGAEYSLHSMTQISFDEMPHTLLNSFSELNYFFFTVFLHDSEMPFLFVLASKKHWSFLRLCCLGDVISSAGKYSVALGMIDFLP